MYSTNLTLELAAEVWPASISAWAAAPSMQLLARQRIPRLEKAIKHLIASLAESA